MKFNYTRKKQIMNIFISNHRQKVDFEHQDGPVEFGRNERKASNYYRIDDQSVSGEQFRAEMLPEGQLHVENLSRKVDIRFADGTRLLAGSSCDKGLPCRLLVGESLVHFELGMEHLLRSVDRPIQTIVSSKRQDLSIAGLGEAPTAESVAHWLERLVIVQMAAAGAANFYQATARAVVELIGLDYGVVLLLEPDNNWRTVAEHGNTSEGASHFSRTILDKVVSQKRTYYQDLPETTVRSLAGVSAVVAAPVLGSDGQTVLGAVYGVRAPSNDVRRSVIRPLDAQLVQVLACAVGAGLARIRGEEKAALHRQQFEDFFSTELAAALESNPRLLEGERREITILFCDIRNFSRISESISPEQTCSLIRDVMERLTQRIRQHQGVVIDYIGDALLALWNAPTDQLDHATLACNAALSMLEELPALNATWSECIHEKLDIGIGLNTGLALIGNTGSHSRLKYGPLGHAVNLASRVEGATKQFGVQILLTQSTFDSIQDAGFATRRLCQLQMVGIEGSVYVYELHSQAVDPQWYTWRDKYESGLDQFEHGELSHACRILHSLMEGRRGDYDLATLHLVSRALDFLKDPKKQFNPVLKLESK